MNPILIPKVDANTAHVPRLSDVRRLDVDGSVPPRPGQHVSADFEAVFLAHGDATAPLPPEAAAEMPPDDTLTGDATDVPDDDVPAGAEHRMSDDVRTSDEATVRTVRKHDETSEEDALDVRLARPDQERDTPVKSLGVDGPPRNAHADAEGRSGQATAHETIVDKYVPRAHRTRPVDTHAAHPSATEQTKGTKTEQAARPVDKRQPEPFATVPETRKVDHPNHADPIARHHPNVPEAVPKGAQVNPRDTSQAMLQDVPSDQPETAKLSVASSNPKQSTVRVPRADLIPVRKDTIAPIDPKVTRELLDRVPATPHRDGVEGPEPAPQPVTKPPVKLSVAQTMLLATMDSAGQADADAVGRLQGDAAEVVHWDVRAAHPTAVTATPALAIHRADLPPHVAQHLAVALQKSPDKPVEIALNPPELGRVRMVMSASDTGMVVQVLTERSDTLDLMRRNIDDLGRALSDLGYEDISFNFGQGNAGETQSGPDGHDDDTILIGADVDPSKPQTPPSHVSPLALAPDAIDIRL